MAEIALSSAGEVILKDGKVACSCCCPTTLPAWQYDSIGKSLTKIGWSEFADPSTPPKRYRNSVFTGSVTAAVHKGEFCETPGDYDYTVTYTQSGYSEFGGVNTANLHRSVTGSSSSSSDCTFISGNGATWGTGTCQVGTPWFDTPTQTATQTTYTRSVSGCYPHGGASSISLQSGDLVATLADEYTTDQLKADVHAAIDAEGFDGDWNDTAGSYRNLPEDELSFSERRSKARLPLTGLGVALEDGKTYNAIYVIRFTPSVGASTDGAEQTLAVNFSTGMTHSDPIDIEVPAANGTNTAVLLRWECPEDEEEEP